MPLKGDLCHTNGGIYGQKLSKNELNFHEKLQEESISNETNMEVIRRVISFNHLAATSYQRVQWFTCLLLVLAMMFEACPASICLLCYVSTDKPKALKRY